MSIAPPGSPVRRIPVTVVLPPQTLLLDVAGPLEVIRRANIEQSSITFDVSYVGAASSVLSSVGLTVADLAPLPRALDRDTVVIVAGNVHSVLGNTPENPQDAIDVAGIVAWLRHSIMPSHTLICICGGAVLAGRAGLLDQRSCTTHHASIDELREAAPRAKVVENRLFIEDGNCLTSAGVTAGIDLMLFVVGRLTSAGIASSIARHLVVYIRRFSSDPQISPWLLGRNHAHSAVHQVQDAITAEPTRSWRVTELAKISGMSSRHLARLFNTETGMSIPGYINLVRVARAMELIEGTRLSIDRIAEEVGFRSTRHFRRAWSLFHPEPPGQARRGASVDRPETLPSS